MRRLGVLGQKQKIRAERNLFAKQHPLERALANEVFITAKATGESDDMGKEGHLDGGIRREGVHISSTEPGGPFSGEDGQFPWADFDLGAFGPLLEFLAQCYSIDIVSSWWIVVGRGGLWCESN